MSWRSSHWSLLSIAVVVALLAASPMADADGAWTLPLPVTKGCFGMQSYGVALMGGGKGRVTLSPPGPILGVFINWVGLEDDTPPTPGTSTLTINGATVVGLLVPGAAGFSSPDWYAWWANIGPLDGPFFGSGIVNDAKLTVDIKGWDAIDETNGATITVVYDVGPCGLQSELQVQLGVDWYWAGTPGQPLTELMVYPFAPSDLERKVSLHVGHAGTDPNQVACRGGAIWLVTGSGSAPAPTDFDIIGIAPGGRGFGQNGGVEIVNDPFTSSTLPCVPELNPVPDQAYEAGHPCSAGAATCPYRAVAIRPLAGGDVGAEWGVLEIDATVPPLSTWLAIQMEAEADQRGESGSWSGVSFLLESPTTSSYCGDGVLDPGEECDDGNNTDGDGCDADCRRECPSSIPPELRCVDQSACTDPGVCAADVPCDGSAIVSCAIGPITVTCTPAGPYPVGRTDIVIRTSVAGLEETCAVTVRDCEPPTCDAPPEILLECEHPRGIPASDPRIVALVDGVTAADNCAGVTISKVVPERFPADCDPGARTPIVFVAADATGHETTCATDVVVRDTTPPSATCPADLTLECNGTAPIDPTDPRIQAWLDSARATDLCGTVTITHDPPPAIPSSCAPGTATPVTFRATDDCGYTASCAAAIRVLDTTDPEIACPAPLVLDCPAGGKIPVTDPRIQAWLRTVSATDTCATPTITNDAPAAFESSCAGLPSIVRFTAVDGCGNLATCTSSVTVRDPTDPEIVCPAPLVLDCPGGGKIPVTDPRIQAWLRSVSASDTCATPTITNDAPAAFESACGAHPANVRFTAVDGCGNLATCTSSVTVSDVTAPAITCPPPLELGCEVAGGLDATDPRIQAWLASATAVDTCGIARLSYTAPSRFPSGCAPGLATPVTWHATDPCGNLSSCTSTVSIADLAQPIIDCPAPITLECTEPGGVSVSDPRIQAWLGQAHADDVCGRASLTNNRPDFFTAACDPGNQHDIAFRAADECGNVAACDSSITILDSPAKVLDCPPMQLCISPPNHEYVCFRDISLLAAVSEPCGDTTAAVVVLCKSSQCDDAPCPERPGEDGDGTTTEDCLYDPLTDEICVRSERAGSDPNGRYYDIAFAAQDRCGQSDPVVALRFWIPHDHSNVAHCIDADARGHLKMSLAPKELIEEAKRRRESRRQR